MAALDQGMSTLPAQYLLSSKQLCSCSILRLRRRLAIVEANLGSRGANGPMNPFTAKVINIIRNIPEGYVMTYGQIAALAGSARGARQVVRILHSMSDSHKLPWHRVVNAKGEIAIRDDEFRFQQSIYLSGEGVDIDDSYRIDLERYRYIPDSNLHHGE